MATTQARDRSKIGVGVAVLVLGIILALIAQFPLDGLADTSDTWHMIQHGTFFVGGIIVGIGGTMLYVSGQRAA